MKYLWNEENMNCKSRNGTKTIWNYKYVCIQIQISEKNSMVVVLWIEFEERLWKKIKKIFYLGGLPLSPYSYSRKYPFCGFEFLLSTKYSVWSLSISELLWSLPQLMKNYSTI